MVSRDTLQPITQIQAIWLENPFFFFLSEFSCEGKFRKGFAQWEWTDSGGMHSAEKDAPLGAGFPTCLSITSLYRNCSNPQQTKTLLDKENTSVSNPDLGFF